MTAMNEVTSLKVSRETHNKLKQKKLEQQVQKGEELSYDQVIKTLLQQEEEKQK